MKIKTKKIQCVLLAVMMVFICATSSFAATYNDGNGDIVSAVPVEEQELKELTVELEEPELAHPIQIEVYPSSENTFGAGEFGVMATEAKIIYKCSRCEADVYPYCSSFISTSPTGVCTDIVNNCQVWTRLHKTIFPKCGCGQGFYDGEHSHEAVHTACGRGTLLICIFSSST